MPEAVAAESTTDVVVHVSVPPVALAPGGVDVAVTEAVAVLVHPLLVLVTVTVNVPVELTRGFAVLPPDTIPVPDQLNTVPPPAAESTTNVVVQVSVPPVALAPGGARFGTTEAVAVLVSPLVESVTVTIWLPVELTLGLAVLPPLTMPGPDQLKLTLGADDAADRTTDVVVHVSIPPVALAPGGLVDERVVRKTSPPFSPANTTPALSTSSERFTGSVSPPMRAIQFPPIFVETNTPLAVPAMMLSMPLMARARTKRFVIPVFFGTQEFPLSVDRNTPLSVPAKTKPLALRTME